MLQYKMLLSVSKSYMLHESLFRAILYLSTEKRIRVYKSSRVKGREQDVSFQSFASISQLLQVRNIDNRYLHFGYPLLTKYVKGIPITPSVNRCEILNTLSIDSKKNSLSLTSFESICRDKDNKGAHNPTEQRDTLTTKKNKQLLNVAFVIQRMNGNVNGFLLKL